MLDTLLDALIALVITWILLLLLFALIRPKGSSFSGAVQLLPDMAVLFHGLSKDKALPWHLRLRPLVWVAWAASPPAMLIDTIPVIGFSDEVVLALWVVRSTVRRAGREVLERHWHGSSDGLAFLERLAGLPGVTL
jgi:uncharacterized membrane protein YkvA (DUF1232 family)